MFIIAAAFSSGSLMAQDIDLFKVLDEDSKKADAKRTNYSTATFKTTRLINGHSVEDVGRAYLTSRYRTASTRLATVSGSCSALTMPVCA